MAAASASGPAPSSWACVQGVSKETLLTAKFAARTFPGRGTREAPAAGQASAGQSARSGQEADRRFQGGRMASTASRPQVFGDIHGRQMTHVGNLKVLERHPANRC